MDERDAVNARPLDTPYGLSHYSAESPILAVPCCPPCPLGRERSAIAPIDPRATCRIDRIRRVSLVPTRHGCNVGVPSELRLISATAYFRWPNLSATNLSHRPSHFANIWRDRSLARLCLTDNCIARTQMSRSFLNSRNPISTTFFGSSIWQINSAAN